MSAVLEEPPTRSDALQRADIARRWGQTALMFIFSAAATGIFGLLSYVLWPVNRVPAVPCCALTVFFFLIFGYSSYSIVRWWIVLANMNRSPQSVERA